MNKKLKHNSSKAIFYIVGFLYIFILIFGSFINELKIKSTENKHHKISSFSKTSPSYIFEDIETEISEDENIDNSNILYINECLNFTYFSSKYIFFNPKNYSLNLNNKPQLFWLIFRKIII